MPRLPSTVFVFPYHFVITDVVNGQFSTALVEWESKGRKTVEFHSAFEKCLKESRISPLKTTQKVLYCFVDGTLNALGVNLRLVFVQWDHDDDDGPSFFDSCSNNIKKILNDLGDLITRTVQNQYPVITNRQVIRTLLEESGVQSLLANSSPELLLARCLDETELARQRAVSKQSPLPSVSKSFDNFEASLAKHQVRQKGLKVRENSNLISRLTKEIRNRTSAYDTQAAVSIEEEVLPEQSEPGDQGEDEDTHTQYKEKKEKRKQSERIWNHLTISRDETSASDFMHERIIIFFVKTKLYKQEQVGLGKVSARRTESSEISEREHQVQPRHRRSLGGTTFRQALTRRISPEQTTFGTRADYRPLRASPQQKMGATDNEGSPVEVQEGGSNLTTSTGEKESIRSRQLISRIASLELEIQRLEKDKQVADQNWKILHFISQFPSEEPTGYFDKPVMAPGVEHDDFGLRAFLPVTDVSNYVKQSGLDFVVSRFYSAWPLQGQVRAALARKQPLPEPLHYQEQIQLQSQEMIEAFQEFLSLQPEFWDKFPDFDVRAPVRATYIFRYMYRSIDVLQQLQQPHADLVRMLISWIDENYAETYAEADSNFERGVVTLKTMPFLTYPGDVLIWKEKRRMKAAVTSSLLLQTTPVILYWDSLQIMWSGLKPDKGVKKGEFSTTWAAEAWNYKFIGEFFRQNRRLFSSSKLHPWIKRSRSPSSQCTL